MRVILAVLLFVPALAGCHNHSGGCTTSSTTFVTSTPTTAPAPGTPGPISGLTVTVCNTTVDLPFVDPNVGSSAVSTYRMLRGTAPGTETFLVDVSVDDMDCTPLPAPQVGKSCVWTDGTDPNAPIPDVPTVYYQVQFVNAAGMSPPSQEVAVALP